MSSIIGEHLSKHFYEKQAAVRVDQTWYTAEWSDVRLAHRLVPLSVDTLDSSQFETFQALPRVEFQSSNGEISLL